MPPYAGYLREINNVHCKRERFRMLIFVQIIYVSFFAVRSVGSQNSINPRRTKTNLTSGVLSCPNVEHEPATACTISCLRDEHCENRGDDLKCCLAPPGSSCKAECREPVLTVDAAKSCYDFEQDRKYSIGDVFPKDGVCCQCNLGGFLNCSKSLSCKPGCYYESKYYKDRDFIVGSKCRNCSCYYGAVRCKLKPNCTQDKCKYKGKVYKPDHVIRLDHGCKECVCQIKGWSCSAITCNAESSSSSAVSIETVKTSVLVMLVMLSHPVFS